MKPALALLLLIIVSPPARAGEISQHDIQVYGQNIHYGEIGQGPPVVLLHGLWGGQNEWQPVIGPLAETHRVIVMDLIGFHGSDKPAVHYHNALLAEFLRGFIDKLKLANVTLLGHAMGANVATYTAYHHSEKISALILVDGAGYRSPDRDLSKPPAAGMLRFRRAATGSSLAATRGLLERRVSDKSLITNDWVVDAFALWVDSAMAIGDMLAEGGDLTEEEMRQIKLPTLVVWGSEDKVFSPDNAKRLQKDIDGAELIMIEGSGHLPQIEKTGPFLDAVMAFLRKQGD